MLQKIYLFILLFVLISLNACDKQKRTAKELKGDWNIISYKLTDNEGLNKYATVQGKMVFDETKDITSPSNYSLNFSYVFSNSTGNTIQNGTYKIIQKGNFMDLTINDVNNNVIDTFTYRILTLTKTDLQVEYTDNVSQIHTYIFTKN